jgi:hypothetical protein
LSRVILDDIQHRLKNIIPELKWTDGQKVFVSDLLKEFQNFWRKGSMSFPLRHSEFSASQYDEATYSFMLEAFLQRVANGGAKIFRQFAEGRGAVDLCILYKERQYLLEAKIKGHSTLKESLTQLAGYLDSNGEQEGWLVIFDREREKKWEEKIYWNTQQFDGKTIHVVGC